MCAPAAVTRRRGKSEKGTIARMPKICVEVGGLLDGVSGG
jgi:hypothetical protein